jgi:hypothetical protein
LRNWVKQDEINAEERERLTTEEPEKLRRPGREAKVLHRESS